MPSRNGSAPTYDNGFVRTDSGILAPPSAARSGLRGRSPGPVLKNFLDQQRSELTGALCDGFNYGVRLNRGRDDLIIRWSQKGSGLDDMVSGAIVEGRIANATLAPTIFPQLTGIIKRQMAQASTADLTLTGRKTPVNSARRAIGMFNDSPLGFSSAIQEIVFRLNTYNRGAPIATVPIVYPTEQWAECGLMAIPLDGDENQDPTRYYLEVDWQKHGTPIPFLPSVFDIEPTGDALWPYWYHTQIDGRSVWVLLHQSQIITLIPCVSTDHGRNYGQLYHSCVGTSPVYAFWSILAEHVLVVDRKIEQMVNSPTDGFLGISGVAEDPDKIKARLEAEVDTSDRILHRGYTVLTSEEDIKFESFSLRGDDGMDPVERHRHYEDVLALLMGEPLQAVVQRGGLSVQQADTASEDSADAGVNSLLHMIGIAFGAIYPRVQVIVARQNDRAQRQNIEALADFASAVNNLPEGTLTTEEIRTIIDSQIMPIPDTGDDLSTQQATADQDESQAAAEPSEEELSSMIYDAQTLDFISVVEALGTDTAEELFIEINDGLVRQYRSLDVEDLVGRIREAEVDPNGDTAIDDTTEIITDNELMDDAQEGTDLDEVIALLIILLAMGRDEAIEQASAVDVEVDDAQREAAENDGMSYVDDRVQQLYIEATGEEQEAADLDDATLPQTLDPQSRRAMAGLTIDAMRSNDDNRVPGIVAGAIAGAAATRAAGIADNEGGRAFNNGFSNMGRRSGATLKRWERTTSENPRQIHLDDVGLVVGINESFPSGDAWAGQRNRCKCSITLLFGES